MGLGMLFSALSGAGNAAANVGRDYQAAADAQAAQQRQFDQQRTLEQLRSDLNVEQAARIAENQRVASAKPLNDFSSLLKKYSNEDIPVEAAPVTELTGAGMGPGQSGLHGDPAQWSEMASRMPPGPDKDALIAQIRSQVDADQLAASNAVDGVARKRTPEEAMAAALADAKINDPVAYAAGKTLNADKYLQVTSGGAVVDTTTGKVVYQNPAMQDREVLRAETRLAVAEGNHASDEKIAALRADLAKANGGNTPSTVATADALVAHGVAKTWPEAWLMVKEKSSASGGDTAVKIAGILAAQPGYKPTSKTGRGFAADLFADASALANGLGSVGSPASPAAERAPVGVVPSAGAIDYLIKNPQLQDQFDAKYGPGSAIKYLGK